MDLIALLLRTPVISRLVSVPVVAVCAAQQHLGPRAGALETWRDRWWRRAHALFSRVDGYAIDRSTPAEYVCSVELPLDELERRLWNRDHHRNLLAAKKYRQTAEGVEWSASSWVSRERFWADDQLHVTLFARPGGVDCYVHREPSPVTRPLDHWLVEDQVVGDPDGAFREALAAADVGWFRDERLASAGGDEPPPADDDEPPPADGDALVATGAGRE